MRTEDFTYVDPWAQNFDTAMRGAGAKAILALGEKALNRLSEHNGIDKLRGYVFTTPFGFVVPTYHPRALIRAGGRSDGSGAKGKIFLSPVVQYDILTALEIARNGLKRPEKQYILRPSIMDAVRWADAYEAAGCPPLSFDIETPDRKRGGADKDDELLQNISREDDPSWSCIYRISFSYAPNTAITMVWEPPFTTVIKRLLASPGTKIGWNLVDFDIPRVEHHGAVVNGRIVDGLAMWHYTEPHLPAGLKYVANLFQRGIEAWKLNQHSSPEWYSCADSDQALIAVEGITALLQRQSRWDAFERYVILLTTELRKITSIGVATDGVLRAKERAGFETRFNAAIAELQTIVPEPLLPRQVFKISRERIEKNGHDVSRLFPVWEEAIVKPGWMVNEEGDLVKIPKPPKEKKPRGKRKQSESSGDSGSSPRKRRVRVAGGLPLPDSGQEGSAPGERGDGTAPVAA